MNAAMVSFKAMARRVVYHSLSRRIECRERILAPNEADTESLWLECIGYAIMIFLQEDDPEEAFSVYDAATAQKNWPQLPH